MKNEANTISTAILPRAALIECLELSQVFDLETCDDKIWICFELATDSVFSNDALTKYANMKIILQYPFFLFFFLLFLFESWNQELEENKNEVVKYEETSPVQHHENNQRS